MSPFIIKIQSSRKLKAQRASSWIELYTTLKNHLLHQKTSLFYSSFLHSSLLNYCLQSFLNQHGHGTLHDSTKFLQPLCTHCTVNDSMIATQRRTHDRCRTPFVDGVDDNPLFYGTHGKNACLGGYYDGFARAYSISTYIDHTKRTGCIPIFAQCAVRGCLGNLRNILPE